MKKSQQKISPKGMELYAKCPKLFQLTKDAGLLDDVREPEDDFASCIRGTINHMYLIELISKHKAEFKSVKIFWDKVFWKLYSDMPEHEALSLSERGLDIIYKYYTSIYSLKSYNIAAIKAPYGFRSYEEKILIPTELDVIITDVGPKEVYVLSFIESNISDRDIKKHVLSSIPEMLKIASIHNEIPNDYSAKATFYSVTSDDINGYTLDIEEDLVDRINSTIRFLSMGIHNEIYCPSKSSDCQSCDCENKCEI